jgi:hypothetical protein
MPIKKARKQQPDSWNEFPNHATVSNRGMVVIMQLFYADLPEHVPQKRDSHILSAFSITRWRTLQVFFFISIVLRQKVVVRFSNSLVLFATVYLLFSNCPVHFSNSVTHL